MTKKETFKSRFHTFGHFLYYAVFLRLPKSHTYVKVDILLKYYFDKGGSDLVSKVKFSQ